MSWGLPLTQLSSCSIADATDVNATNFIEKTGIYVANINDRNFDGTPFAFVGLSRSQRNR
jgi:hypothetical protein